MLELLLAATIASSVPSAVETTLAKLGQLPADSDIEAENALKRRIFKLEVENETNDVLADMTSLDILSTSCDTISSGVAFAEGGVEGNGWTLYGAKTNPYIFIGVKTAAVVAKFIYNKRQAKNFVACRLDQYDGKGGECNQLRNLKFVTFGKSSGDLGLCSHNIRQALKLRAKE